jgi:single-stranded DNA-binding protein
MALGVNNCEFIGNVGKFIEFKKLFAGTPNEQTVGKFSICTSTSAGGGKTNDFWHNIVIYGEIAKKIEQHLKAGRLVRVVAEHRPRKVVNETGTVVYHEFVVGSPLTSFLFMDSGQARQENSAQTGLTPEEQLKKDEEYAMAMIPGYKPQVQRREPATNTSTQPGFPDDDRSMPLSEMEAAGNVPETTTTAPVETPVESKKKK